MLPSSLAFAAPWVLGFLVCLPLLWWLLRLTPPSPHKVVFPALALLRKLVQTEQTPAHTPWWLLLLRLIIAALLIVAMAEPLINPEPVVAGKGTLLIVIDNDWASARDWQTRQTALHTILEGAAHEDRQVLFLPTTPPATGDALQMMGPLVAKAALSEVDHLKPEAWPSDWLEAKNLIEKTDTSSVSDILWLTSGVGNVDEKIFYESLKTKGSLKILADPETPIYLLEPPQNEPGDENPSLAVLRARTDDAASADIVALAADGHVLTHLPVSFPRGAPRALASLTLPLDIRNQVSRFEIAGLHSAATTVLLDASWQHRPVGLIGDKVDLDQHSLLSGLFYIDRALKPYADVHVDSLDALMKDKMAVIFLTDTTELKSDQIDRLTAWIKAGGILVRFAGERLATSSNPEESALLPINLRTGDRAMGGTLSWSTPQKLAAFTNDSPFFGLLLPEDVTISRQVLAEPSSDLASHSWASLVDGTPLVTAKPIGAGLTVLFHVPAKSDWSNLPLSGLFVSMLERIIDLSHGTSGKMDFSSLAPLKSLDAFGDLAKPDAAALTLTDDELQNIKVGPQHPPGLYGTATLYHAVNLGASLGQPEALKDIEAGSYLEHRSEKNLQPTLLLAAFFLILFDILVSLKLRGLLSWRRGSSLCLLLALAFTLHPAFADDNTKAAVELTSKTYLAYVKTGDHDTDHTSLLGLTGLSNILQRRTSLDQVGVTGVNPNTDELAFFPIIYWPLISGADPLTPLGVDHINDYLHHGGMILFDTMTGEALPANMMQKILANIDIPPLAKIPQNHVLRRSFYLLDDFPGRFDTPDLWLEPEELSSYDSVATVLLGSNGWAEAWAVDDTGRPLFPCVPGGEQQRERAYRFGVNIAMYALTGNYKSDQLHAQALLERMGK